MVGRSHANFGAKLRIRILRATGLLNGGLKIFSTYIGIQYPFSPFSITFAFHLITTDNITIDA